MWLNQCRFPAAPIRLTERDSVSLRRLAKRTRDAIQSRRRWRWPASTMVAAGRMRLADRRRESAGIRARCAALQRPRTGRAGRMGSHRRILEANADHRRALAEVVEAGPVPTVTASCAGGARTWRERLLETVECHLLDETTVGRELNGETASPRSRRGRALRAKRAGRRGFAVELPRRTGGSGRNSRKASR